MISPLVDKLVSLVSAPDALHAFMAVQEEIQSRPIRIQAIPAYVLPAGFGDVPELNLFPKGAGTCVTCSSPDPYVKNLQDAFDKKDPGLLSAAIKDVELHHSLKLPRQSKEEYLRRCQNIPVFADIRYKDKTLVSSIFVSGNLPVRVDLLQYNGGTIDTSQFRAVEYYRTDADQPLQTLIVFNPPSLSDAERAALGSVTDHTERNVAGFNGMTTLCFDLHQNHDLIDAHGAGNVGFTSEGGAAGLRPTLLKLLDLMHPRPSVADLLKLREEMIRRT